MQGCVFSSRCPLAQRVCVEETPAYREALPGHYVACHLVEAGQPAALLPNPVLATAT